MSAEAWQLFDEYDIPGIVEVRLGEKRTLRKNRSIAIEKSQIYDELGLRTLCRKLIRFTALNSFFSRRTALTFWPMNRRRSR